MRPPCILISIWALATTAEAFSRTKQLVLLPKWRKGPGQPGFASGCYPFVRVSKPSKLSVQMLSAAMPSSHSSFPVTLQVACGNLRYRYAQLAAAATLVTGKGMQGVRCVAGKLVQSGKVLMGKALHILKRVTVLFATLAMLGTLQSTNVPTATARSTENQIAHASAPAAMPQFGGVVRWRYSQLINAVNSNRIAKVTFSSDGQRLLAVDTDGNRYAVNTIPNDPGLMKTLVSRKVDIQVLPMQEQSGMAVLAQSLIFPALLLGGLLLMSRRGGDMGPMGGMGPMQFGKSQARVQALADLKVKFSDVAGCAGPKSELEEVVQFLKHTERFTSVGAKIPRGVLLEGPPGTGKTLLARAVAGEAGVPFFSISGSEFVEMFVGVGASRVRDLFATAKKHVPCIIFIDEIDAVGRQRGGGMAGGNDEREQTLNQLLTEMDGFEGNTGIIVIAATNRADVLDMALLRPGRFDRRIMVELPDLEGRTQILQVHARGKPMGPDVDLEQVARRTPGLSGASLSAILNEAAIYTASRDKTQISLTEVEDAVDRHLVGLVKKGAVPYPDMQRVVAFHEAGHAVVGALVPDYDAVAKITIVPRSNGAAGLTFFAPDDTRLQSGLYSKQYLEAQMAVALGGRVAEELIFGVEQATTGASNDLQQVASIAKRMVTQWGFSEKIGPMAVEEERAGPYMGQQASGEQRNAIDEEVRRLVNQAYEAARSILLTNNALLHSLADLLIEQETVSAEELNLMIAKQYQ